VVPDADHRIKLQVFEGPLDLLLFLIRKNELDIYDIPIEQVTRQYLDVLFSMQQLDHELAAEQQDMIARHISALSRRDDRPLKNTDRIELWNVFNVVLRRLAEKLVIGEIHDEQVTVADQMEMLLARLQTQPRFVFSQLFTTTVSLRTLIATFLAVLELVRLKRLRVRQEGTFADILCEAASENELETPAARSPVTA
jgi:segregation and condensation protein A